MGVMRTIITICMMILVLVGTTTMASRLFPSNAHADDVCCVPGFPCCYVPIPPGADEEDGSETLLAPSPSTYMAHGTKAQP
ncbi:hypothetical protein LXL04_007053 [Taraxacum kok-saghyz]